MRENTDKIKVTLVSDRDMFLALTTEGWLMKTNPNVYTWNIDKTKAMLADTVRKVFPSKQYVCIWP